MIIYRKKILSLTLSTFLLASLCGSASAQVTQQTGIASPDRVEDQFRSPAYDSRLSPDIEIKQIRSQSMPDGASDTVFTLSSIQLEGVTAYETETLSSIYADQLGKEVSLADIYKIAEELTKKYRNDGYILTQVIVPVQTIESGIVRLKVIEGYIDKISIEQADGVEHDSLQLFRNYASLLQEKNILNVKDLERVTLLISDVAGAQARTVLRPSQTQTGASDLLIVIERTAFEGSLSMDNYGTRYLGPVQIGATAIANSYFGHNERLSAQFFIAPEAFENSELLYFALGAEKPVNKHGTTVGVNATYASTEPGYTLQEFDVKGWSSSLSATVEHPFVRSRSLNVTGRASFDLRESTTKNNILADPTREDRVRAIRLGGTFEYLDNFFVLAFNSADIVFSQGLDIFGANSPDQTDQSRPGADPKFTKVEATVERLQNLKHNFNLLLAMNGQWSSSSLASSEEYGLGGSRFGRGYDPSEVIGDNGLAGTIELQWENPYDVDFLNNYQLYGFYDAGRVWDDTQAVKLRRETLTSTGLGLRGSISDQMSLGAMLAVPLNTTPETQDDRDTRFFFNIRRDF